MCYSSGENVSKKIGQTCIWLKRCGCSLHEEVCHVFSSGIKIWQKNSINVNWHFMNVKLVIWTRVPLSGTLYEEEQNLWKDFGDSSISTGLSPLSHPEPFIPVCVHNTLHAYTPVSLPILHVLSDHICLSGYVCWWLQVTVVVLCCCSQCPCCHGDHNDSIETWRITVLVSRWLRLCCCQCEDGRKSSDLLVCLLIVGGTKLNFASVLSYKHIPLPHHTHMFPVEHWSFRNKKIAEVL